MSKHFRDEMEMIGKHGRPVRVKEDHFWIRIQRAIWVCYMYEEASAWDYQARQERKQITDTERCKRVTTYQHS